MLFLLPYFHTCAPNSCIGILAVFALAVHRVLAAREAQMKRYMRDPENGMEMSELAPEGDFADEFEEDFPGQMAVGGAYLPQGY